MEPYGILRLIVDVFFWQLARDFRLEILATQQQCRVMTVRSYLHANVFCNDHILYEVFTFINYFHVSCGFTVSNPQKHEGMEATMHPRYSIIMPN